MPNQHTKTYEVLVVPFNEEPYVQVEKVIDLYTLWFDVRDIFRIDKGKFSRLAYDYSTRAFSWEIPEEYGAFPSSLP